MKYYALLLAFAFLSCNKENNAPALPVDELVVNNVKLTGSTGFAVGQVLKITTPIANRRADLDFSWTLSPNENEEIQINNSEVSWRPAKPQQYTLGVAVQSSVGEQGSKQYAFNILPADIRYYLWGASRADVEYSEIESLSEKKDGYGNYVEYLVHHTDTEYDTKNAVQPGEYVMYFFDNDRLSGADVYSVMENQTDPNEYYKRYQELKSRLSAYNYLGNENKWLETNEEAMQYKNTPERWGEAFAKGYITLHDRFDNERTNIMLESYGPHSGTLLIVIRYSQKK